MNQIDRCYDIFELQPAASVEQTKQACRDLAILASRSISHNSRLQEKAQIVGAGSPKIFVYEQNISKPAPPHEQSPFNAP